MIRIPQKLNIILLAISLISIVIYSIMTVNNFNTEIFFKHSKSVFVCILLTAIIFDSYMINNKSKILKLNSFLFLVLLVASINFAFSLIKLINFGWLDGKQLYWQIASFIIGILSIGLLIYVMKKYRIVNNNVA